MPLQKLIFKPGVNRENTRYTNEGSWWLMDKVRFRSGTPEKIGGWTRLSTGVFQGVARFMHNWVTLGSENLLAVGTNLKVYLERGGLLSDITPIRYTVAQANPFTTTNLSTTVTVTTTAVHGAILGDFVTFSGAGMTDIGGITAASLKAEFQITSVPSTTTFTFTAPTAATSSAGPGGGTATIDFQVSVGPAVSVVGTGYGVGAYGTGGYGEAATGAGVVTSGMRQWVGDNYGENLVFAVRDGGLYYWKAQTGGVSITTALATRGTLLSAEVGAASVPTVADNLIVTEDQHVVLFGTNSYLGGGEDPLLVRWCDQGNIINWVPSATTTSGEQRLTSGSYIYAVAKMRQENLIWTDTALTSMQYVGLPVVFSFTPLATNISIASVNAVGIADNAAYWMGKDKFYVYNGTVQTLPCDVRKYVFGDMNRAQMGQVFAGTNSGFNEVTWHYVSSTATYPDRYVTYNYVERIWTFGTLDRSAWLDTPLRDYPVAAGLDNRLYYHESGVDDTSTTIPSGIHAYLESSDFDIGDGQTFSFVDQVIHDVDFEGSTAAVPAVTVTLAARDTPGSSFRAADSNSRTVQTSIANVTPFTEMSWVRVRGRQVTFRIESTDAGVAWQLGSPRIAVRQDGQK
jgi:hypothetical protein